MDSLLYVGFSSVRDGHFGRGTTINRPQLKLKAKFLAFPQLKVINSISDFRFMRKPTSNSSEIITNQLRLQFESPAEFHISIISTCLPGPTPKDIWHNSAPRPRLWSGARSRHSVTTFQRVCALRMGIEDNVIDQINPKIEICIGRRRRRLRQHLYHVLYRILERQLEPRLSAKVMSCPSNLFHTHAHTLHTRDTRRRGVPAYQTPSVATRGKNPQATLLTFWLNKLGKF